MSPSPIVGFNLAALSNGIYAKLTLVFAADISHQLACATEPLHSYDNSDGSEIVSQILHK